MDTRQPDLARLQRWMAAGGGWSVEEASDAAVTVLLLRCDGGEELERFTSTAPEVLAFVRASSPDA